MVKTKPKDWETTTIDLTDFVTRVNGIKSEHSVFQEDAPTEILSHDNRDILLMWKASSSTREESLLVLNKDIDNSQDFYTEDLHQFVQAGAPMVDMSPEDPLKYIPTPFSYDLRPGQGIVLVTTRDAVQDD